MNLKEFYFFKRTIIIIIIKNYHKQNKLNRFSCERFNDYLIHFQMDTI